MNESKDISPSFLESNIGTLEPMQTDEWERWDKPGLNNVSDGTKDTKEDKKSGSSNICPSEEGVLAADPRDCRDYDRLRALVWPHGVICRPFPVSSLSRKASCIYSLKLTAIW